MIPPSSHFSPAAGGSDATCFTPDPAKRHPSCEPISFRRCSRHWGGHRTDVWIDGPFLKNMVCSRAFKKIYTGGPKRKYDSEVLTSSVIQKVVNLSVCHQAFGADGYFHKTEPVSPFFGRIRSASLKRPVYETIIREVISSGTASTAWCEYQRSWTEGHTVGNNPTKKSFPKGSPH